MSNKLYKVFNNYEDKVEASFNTEKEAQDYIDSKHALDDKYSIEEPSLPSSNKHILLSIKPEYACKILNGEKTIDVRKKFPANYTGWVYIYCSKATKSNERLLGNYKDNYYYHTTNDHIDFYSDYMLKNIVNGKVVGRFWCDKAEEMYTDENGMSYYTDTIKKDYMVSKLACLDDSDIENYLGDKIGYAIHISKLEVFDSPKELSEFRHDYVCKAIYCEDCSIRGNCLFDKGLTKAPQNYYYVKVEI